MVFLLNEFIWSIDRFLDYVKGATLKGFLKEYSRRLKQWL